MGACPGCGTANPTEARFCMGCAAPLGGAELPREERRVVTVLFADLAGFTARAETLDPEDVRAFLVPYYEVLTTEVAAHGGRVDRFLGDGVMALFGAPVAHEDDAERAIRAALRIVERVGGLDLGLHVRLGINTGPVLFAAGAGGHDDTVTGDTVNTAARLQAAAPVDGVIVGEPTHRATRHLFVYEPLSKVLVKGKAAPLNRWRPLSPLARLEQEPPDASPFVGRGLELATLTRLFERACAARALEVVTLVADPGLGKSRLVRELGRVIDAWPELVRWRIGRCRPYGEGAGFAALAAIVRSHAGIEDGDDQIALAAKLGAVLTEPDPSLRSWMVERVGPLVGLDVGAAPPQQEEAFTAWRRFLEAIARDGPTVLVVEDLHWADPALVAFLDHLVERWAGLPLLVLATARPELEDRHPAWLARTRRNTVLSLGALGEPEMRALLLANLPDAEPELVATVLARAGGSPLYAEQLAAMLRDVPGTVPDGEAIPGTIGALLAARIDALPSDAKAVLLDASVIGKTFWLGALAALEDREPSTLQAHLTALARRDLVRPVFPSTMADEPEFTFVHALVCEVAYGELPRASRLARHRAIAAWISERHADGSLGSDAGLVAAHLERALELARALQAADEVPAIEAELVDALLGAADHAMRVGPAAASGDLRRVLDLLAHDDARRPDVLGRLARAHVAVFDYAAAVPVFEEAIGLLRDRGDSFAAAELAVPLAVAVGNTADVDLSASLLADAREELEHRPGPGLVAAIAEQAMSAAGQNHNGPALTLAGEAISLAERLRLAAPSRALSARGIARLATGDPGGEADLRLATELAEAAGDLRSAAIAVIDLPVMLAYVSGPAASLAAGGEAIAFMVARGMPDEPVRADRVDALFETGAWDEALAEAGAVRAWGVEHSDALCVLSADTFRAMVQIERGESVGDLEHHYSSALELGIATSVAFVVAEAFIAEGKRESARDVLEDAIGRTPDGELDEAAAVVRACLRAGAPTLARRALERGAPPNPLDTTRIQAAEAMLAEADGDFADARHGFAVAEAAFAGFGIVPERAHALTGLGRCLLALGEVDEGVRRLREAREIWVRLRAAPRLAEIDELLARSGAPSEVP